MNPNLSIWSKIGSIYSNRTNWLHMSKELQGVNGSKYMHRGAASLFGRGKCGDNHRTDEEHEESLAAEQQLCRLSKTLFKIMCLCHDLHS